jgi:hypothetical protein
LPAPRVHRKVRSRPELSGSSFREAGNLCFIKTIIGEIFRRPRNDEDAQISLSRMSGPKGSPLYAPRTVWDLLYACKNLHLIDYVARNKTRIWGPTLNGISWIVLDPNLKIKKLSLTDIAFTLRYLLMIDSNNKGDWFTLALRCIEDNQSKPPSETPIKFNVIRQSFDDRLRARGWRFDGETVNHKLRPALGWATYIGLVKQMKDNYRLTSAGTQIVKLHDKFVDEGYQAFRRQAAIEIADALRPLTKRRRKPVSERLFEREIKHTVKMIQASLKSRRSIAIPLLRNVCCTQFLMKGIATTDEEFDDYLTHLCRRYYYKYSMLRSRETMGYPYAGITTARGAFYYFAVVAT